jgi:cell division protease FtsH
MSPFQPDTQRRSDGQKQQPKKQPPGQSFQIWWLIMIGLLMWNLVTFWPKPAPDVKLPYTAFLDQVRTGNVVEIKITEGQITGSFVNPIQQPKAAAPSPAADNQSSPPAKPAPEVAAKSETTQSRNGASSKPPAQSQKKVPPTYKDFVTTFPAQVGDPGLLPLLEAHNVAVNVEPPSTHWFSFLLMDGFPILILVGLFLWIGMKASRNQNGIFGFSRSKARRYTSDHPRVTFADVAGVDEVKADLQEEVEFLKNPTKYHQLGARIPRGVLLVGHPGTGKTLLARAVAGEAHVPFFSISASEFVEMFVGVGAGRVRSLFEEAKAAAPSIIFIDELDAVGRRRGAGLGQTNDEREQTLNQLLVEMDGFDERQEVIVLAATNRPDVLDPALLRPGRFDREIVVGLPDRTAREGILRIHSSKLTMNAGVDLAVLARSTTGMSGADLANLCNEAALIAARLGHKEIAMHDFEEAIDKIMLGAARPSLQDPAERRIVAYHESGHALVAWYTPEADPVHKLTIIPHGRALGVTEQLPANDRYNYSRSYLLARLAVMLGGRTAEEIVLGDITTGAENDLVEATRMARRMVSRWGMGKMGPVAFKSDEEQPFLGYSLAQGKDYSEATAAEIDAEVRKLLEKRHEAVKTLLESKRAELDSLAAALLQSESLNDTELARILGPCRNCPAPAESSREEMPVSAYTQRPL